MLVKQIFSILSVFILFFGNLAAQEIKLNKVKINKDIQVSLPAHFTLMSEQDIHAKYISYREPIALFTDPSRNVDFGVNLSVTHWKPGDLVILQEFYENSIRTLYNKVEFINKDIETVNGISYAVFEFISTVSGEDSAITQTAPISKYTLIYYAIVNNKTILFNFTCPVQVRENWQTTAHEIMNSIKIKKTL